MESIQKYKVAIYGDNGVGKTSLLNRLVHDFFDEKQHKTIFADLFPKTFQEGQITVHLDLWDYYLWSGNLPAQCALYIRDAMVVVICFDMTNESSLERAEWWVNFVKEERKEALIYIVGTKADLTEMKKVTTEEAKQLALKLNLEYFEVSAKSGQNVKEVFKKVVIDLIDKKYNEYKIQEEQKLKRLQLGYDKLNTYVD